MISPDTTSIISVGCYLWGLLTAFHQASRQLVTSQSHLGLTVSRLGHSSQRLDLAHLRLESRLGLGQKCLVHIPGHCHSPSLASVKSDWFLPFWYRLTWVVPETEPLNGCVCVLSSGQIAIVTY